VRGFPKFADKALDALTHRVRVLTGNPVVLAEVSFELDVHEEFEVWFGEEAFALATAEKVSQENSAFEEFGNLRERVVHSRDGIVS
jgi:hypothetical protein